MDEQDLIPSKEGTFSASMDISDLRPYNRYHVALSFTGL
jgi:hypothetical protein